MEQLGAGLAPAGTLGLRLGVPHWGCLVLVFPQGFPGAGLYSVEAKSALSGSLGGPKSVPIPAWLYLDLAWGTLGPPGHTLPLTHTHTTTTSTTLLLGLLYY